jgi:hypothetical protein
VTLKEADHIFHNVSSFDAVDEKTLLEQNRYKYDYNDVFKRWVSFAANNDMNTYLYFMYTKAYLQWHMCPLDFGDGRTDDDFTAKELIASFDKAESISTNASWFYYLTEVNTFLVFLEVLIVLAHAQEALPFK